MQYSMQLARHDANYWLYRVRTGFGKSWKVLEIDNRFFKDLERFGNLVFGPLGHGKVMDFV
jgi:hypothetical protein